MNRSNSIAKRSSDSPSTLADLDRAPIRGKQALMRCYPQGYAQAILLVIKTLSNVLTYKKYFVRGVCHGRQNRPLICS